MAQTKDIEHIVARQRIALISLIFTAIATFLCLRLAQKEVFEYPTYAALAKGQQFQARELSGKRGQIFVKDGQGKATYPLATNQTVYALNVVPSQISDKRKVAEALSPIIEVGADTIFDQINNTKLYIPPIKRGLSYDEAQKIEKAAVEGVYLTPEEKRFYPEDNLAAQVLGFVNAESKGQYGVEGQFDEMLSSTKGEKGTAKDAVGQVLALSSSYTPPEDGDDVVLTIDRNVQYQTEQVLDSYVKKFGASGGSIIVMDPKTGSIVAMSSRPTFDANRYASYGPEAYLNQAISGTFEPGSTFKPLAMAAALDTGVITPNTTINGTASVRVRDREIFNAEKRPYGRETMTQVLENSDNVGMVYVSRQLGGETFYDYLQRYGFGVATGVELAGEASPGLPPLEELDEINFATMAFGQGISVTPMQLITAINAFANEGKLVQPHIVEQIQRKNGKVDTTPPKEVRQVVSPQAASQVAGMMVRVVEAGGGKPAQVPGYRVAGKTGTAQIAERGIYDPNNHIGNFVGFAPAENPRFVMLVKIDKPKGVQYAEESAAPAFGELAKFLLAYYNVPPSR